MASIQPWGCKHVTENDSGKEDFGYQRRRQTSWIGLDFQNQNSRRLIAISYPKINIPKKGVQASLSLVMNFCKNFLYCFPFLIHPATTCTRSRVLLESDNVYLTCMHCQAHLLIVTCVCSTMASLWGSGDQWIVAHAQLILPCLTGKQKQLYSCPKECRQYGSWIPHIEHISKAACWLLHTGVSEISILW